jgi:hypothetical protein
MYNFFKRFFDMHKIIFVALAVNISTLYSCMPPQEDPSCLLHPVSNNSSYGEEPYHKDWQYKVHSSGSLAPIHSSSSSNSVTDLAILGAAAVIVEDSRVATQSKTAQSK